MSKNGNEPVLRGIMYSIHPIRIGTHTRCKIIARKSKHLYNISHLKLKGVNNFLFFSNVIIFCVKLDFIVKILSDIFQKLVICICKKITKKKTRAATHIRQRVCVRV